MGNDGVVCMQYLRWSVGTSGRSGEWGDKGWGAWFDIRGDLRV